MKQHESAMAFGNRVRFEHAATRQRIRRLDRGPSHRALAAIIDAPGGLSARMRLDRALHSVHGIGGSAATRLLTEAGILAYRSHTRLGDLTPRERRSIAEALLRRADRLSA